MRHLTFAFFTFFFGAFLFAGEISKTYQFSEYNIEQAGEYQFIHFENCMNTGHTGAPSLPWFAVKLLLPPGEKVVSFTISAQKEESIAGTYTIYPQQPSRPLSLGRGEHFQMDEKVYSSAIAYPKKASGIITTEYMNGYSIAMLNICPVQYIPSEGRLSYYSEITVNITTEKAREAETALTLLSSSEKVLGTLGKFVQNPKMLSEYPVRKSRTDDYELLIITPQAFENEFDALTDLYFIRGLKSEVTTSEEISSTMNGQDMQEKIRNYIIQEVQSHNVEFVLLGGDVEHIPYRGFYCYVQSGSGYSDNDIPADLYYSGLDGTWNDNGDNLWGEIGEDDLLPDVAVGRFSFSNQTELNAMLNKTTSYQDNPIPGEFTYPLLAGEHLWNSPLTWGSDYLNLLVGYHDDNGYTTIGIPPDHNIDSLYEKYQSWGGSDIIAEINTGKSFVHHCGHANSSNVMHLSTSDITNSNFSQVNGITHNFTFVFSHGCICGAFDNADCIMEHMVKIENFAAAVIGNSRYGWFNEGQTEGPAAHLHREMVDALYEEQMGRIGAAFVECKIQTAPWVNAPGQHEEGALRWNFYDINILGDPTLQLWTDEPFDVSAQFSSPILVGAASFDVSVTSSGSPVEGLSCTLTKDGIFHGTALSDSNGNATIIIDPLITTVGTAQLTISGYNCLTNTYNIAVSPASGPFIIYQDNTIDDTAGGNANGLVDYGESIEMTINLANAGTGDATNVEATLSTAGQYITITDDFGEYGTIAAGTAVAPVNEFSFDVDAYVPDQYVADFTLDITGDGKDNWSGGFSIILNAPVLEAGTLVIDDNASGNGNGFLDPGETAILSIGVLNTGHSDASETLSTLSTSSSWVTLNNTSSNLGTLEPGINANATFEVSVNANAPIGTLAEFSFNATAGEYSVSEDYASTIGVVVEDWESGGFTQFNWQFAADAPWTMCTDEPWEGDYCVRSGDISDDMQSELYVSLEVLADGDLSFYRKLSSEAEWDYLKFYIDYEFMGEWSGELDWEMVSFPVEAGLHTFRWIYEKDAYYSSGEDCAWIDYIVFPPVDITTGIPIQMSNTGVELSLWPNPTGHILNIDYRIINETEVNISLYDILGQKVLTLQENTFMPAGQYHLSNDVSQLESGIYLCRLQSSNGMLTRKIVIE